MTNAVKYGINTAYKADFDQPAFLGERTTYVICYVPRSGSWLLCDLLRASGVMGVPAEYFNMAHGAPALAKRLGLTTTDAIPFHEFLDALLTYRTTPNGVFGFKVEPGHLDPLIKARAFKTKFHGAKYIFVTRKDIVAQGVSFEIAKQTNQWQASDVKREAEFDESRVRHSIDYITSIAAAWEKIFSASGIEPYRLDYESFLAEPHRICSDICRFVGVETDHVFEIVKSGVEKQSNSVNDDWIRRIRDSTAE